MPPHDDLLHNFPARFELAEFAGEGMALDLDTGSYHRLNASALRVCKSLKRGDSPADAAAALASAFGIDAAESARAVAATLDHLAAPPPPRKPSAIQIEPDGDSYILLSRGRPIWRISGDGRSMTLEAMNPARDQLADWIMWAMPHALALRDVPVIHASAIAIAGQLIAMAGASGAGKTTAARLFTEAGSTLCSEDIIALAGDPDSYSYGVDTEAEANLRAEAKVFAAFLAMDLRRPIDLEGFVALWMIRGRWGASPLSKLLFIESSRRRGSEIFEERLAPIDALPLLLEGSFAEVPCRDVWKNVWDWSLRLANEVPCFRATMPSGLDALRAAAKDYVKAIRQEL